MINQTKPNKTKLEYIEKFIEEAKYHNLDPEFKRRWIEALRSKEYEQGVGHLYNREIGYCCLGVGCIVAGLKIEDIENFGMPEDVADIVLQEKLGDLTNDSYRDYLWANNIALANDAGATFEEIADLIEKHL